MATRRSFFMAPPYRHLWAAGRRRSQATAMVDVEVSGRLVGPPAFKAVGTGDPRPAGSIPVHLRHSRGNGQGDPLGRSGSAPRPGSSQSGPMRRPAHLAASAVSLGTGMSIAPAGGARERERCSDGEEVPGAGVARGVAQLRHGPGLDLADALAGEVEVLPDLFERAGLAPVEPEAEPQDLARPLVQRGQKAGDLDGQ